MSHLKPPFRKSGHICVKKSMISIIRPLLTILSNLLAITQDPFTYLTLLDGYYYFCEKVYDFNHLRSAYYT